jgi:hypothetical protein
MSLVRCLVLRRHPSRCENPEQRGALRQSSINGRGARIFDRKVIVIARSVSCHWKDEHSVVR